MTGLRKLLALAAAVALLGGCSTIDKLTGETDDTVLPGQREEAIPGRTQFPDAPDSATASTSPTVEQAPADGAAAGCTADDPGCAPPAADDTFSDPQ